MPSLDGDIHQPGGRPSTSFSAPSELKLTSLTNGEALSVRSRHRQRIVTSITSLGRSHSRSYLRVLAGLSGPICLRPAAEFWLGEKNGFPNELERQRGFRPAQGGQQAVEFPGWAGSSEIDEQQPAIAVEQAAVDLPARAVVRRAPEKRPVRFAKEPLQPAQFFHRFLEADSEWMRKSFVRNRQGVERLSA